MTRRRGGHNAPAWQAPPPPPQLGRQAKATAPAPRPAQEYGGGPIAPRNQFRFQGASGPAALAAAAAGAAAAAAARARKQLDDEPDWKRARCGAGTTVAAPKCAAPSAAATSSVYEQDDLLYPEEDDQDEDAQEEAEDAQEENIPEDPGEEEEEGGGEADESGAAEFEGFDAYEAPTPRPKAAIVKCHRAAPPPPQQHWQRPARTPKPPPQPPPHPPRQASASVKKTARLPEDLGFNVSKGVVRKGWEIGEMEDGIRPVDDGEPDVFLSHSYSDNCRRVDMALFECDCPNSLTCCSHAYAALVALPHYRHRAALLWAIRDEAAKQTTVGFEVARERLKTAMLQRLPLDDLVDASIEAALGLWTRVDWLKTKRAPQQYRYWSDRVERALEVCGCKIATDADFFVGSEGGTGGLVQERLKALLTKLQMNQQDLAPLFLALGEGSCSSSQTQQTGRKGSILRSPSSNDQENRWAKLCRAVWAHVSNESDVEGGKKKEGVSADDLKAAISSAVAAAELEIDWSVKRSIEKLWRAEELTLNSLGATTFNDMRVKRSDEACYHSFSEFLVDWPDAPESFVDMVPKDVSGGSVGLVEREAQLLLDEFGRDTFSGDGGSLTLASVLNRHFGRLGDASDWEALAERTLATASDQDMLRSGVLLPAQKAIWEPDTISVDTSILSVLADEGWEAAACRLVGSAPPLADLRAWLLWDYIFESRLGSLRSFLQRTAAGVGAIVFELVGGEFVKMEASASTIEAWEAALASVDALRAAESLLAFCHSCGSARVAPLQETLWPAYARLAETLADSLPQFVGEILAELPLPFAQCPSIASFLLRPLQDRHRLETFFLAAGEAAAESAALGLGKRATGILGTGGMIGYITERLKTGRSRGTTKRGKSRDHLVSPASAVRSTVCSNLAPEVPVMSLQETKDVDVNAERTSIGTLNDAATGQKSPAAPVLNIVDVPISESEPVDPAEALVARIRREEFGFSGESPIGGELQVRQNSRLARALRRLAGELYGSDVHWQLELLQNADDNTYDEGLAPTAEFLLKDGEVIFRCNETGFRDTDIRSICDIGNSSKVGVAKYGVGGRVVATGEKGLGFKAVFALTNSPQIFSGPYRIEFDALHPSGIGYVLPRWMGDMSDSLQARQLLEGGWGSALRMPLRPDLVPKQSELFSRLAELPPSALLFLKKLRDVAIINTGSSAGHSGVRMRRTDSHEDRWLEQTIKASVKVERGGESAPEEEQWLLVRRRFNVPEGVSKPGISSPPKTTLVELALPLTLDGQLDQARGTQPVFAFLPVRSFGLTFALQADWAVSSSREELLSGCAWNEFLKAQIPKMMVELVEDVKKEPPSSPLRFSFYGIIPNLSSTSSFFRSVVVQMHAQLRTIECMLTDEDTFCLPRLTLRCSLEVRSAFVARLPSGGGDDSGEASPSPSGEDVASESSPLRSALRAQGFNLIHERVEASVSPTLLDSLGVQRFGASHLLKVLPGAIESRPSLMVWRKALVLLDELLDATPRADVGRLIEVAKQLPILPLEGGTWSAANAGVFLPPLAQDARGFPPALLSELRAVDPRLLAESGGDDSLQVARLRKLLRRLGVAPLTPRQVLRDVVSLLFKASATPSIVPVATLSKPMSSYLAFAGFVAANAELADEIVGPVGWPLVDSDDVAIGRRLLAPALHSPRAACFLEAAKDTAVRLRLPAGPAGLTKAAALGEVLETLGLALPGPLVEPAQGGNWVSSEFEKLVECFSNVKLANGAARARLLAQAMDAAWPRYERYASKEDGSESTFMALMRQRCWIPVDDVDGCSDEGSDETSLRRPCDVVIGTPAIRAVFTEVSLLAGRLTTALSGRFAEALGVVVEPSVALAISVLRSFGRRNPVGPEAASAIYGYLQREAADLEPLRRSATIVVAAGEPAMAAGDVVWEDACAACALPALLPLYGERWRNFFVVALGVPERPTAEQALRRVDHLSSSLVSLSGLEANLDALWTVLLFISERLHGRGPSLGDNGTADAAGWDTIAKSLRHRRCIPIVGSGRVGVPNEGILYADDCPVVQPALLEELTASVALAASPPSHKLGANHWLPLLRAVGLRPFSEACEVAAEYADVVSSRPLTKIVVRLLPLAQRYLYHRHRHVHEALLVVVVARIRGLRVRTVRPPLRLRCRIGEACSAARDVEAFLEETSFLLVSTSSSSTSLPSICVELARLIIPPSGSELAAEEVAARKHAREALATFLLSAAGVVATTNGGGEGDAENATETVCRALGVGPPPPADVCWPTPDEAADEAAAEAAAEAAGALAAAAEAEAAAASAEGPPAAKRQRRLSSDSGLHVQDVQDGAIAAANVTPAAGGSGGARDAGHELEDKNGEGEVWVQEEEEEEQAKEKKEDEDEVTAKGAGKKVKSTKAQHGKGGLKTEGNVDEDEVIKDGYEVECLDAEMEGAEQTTEETGKAKGKGRGKGRGKEGKGKEVDRDADEIGEVFKGLPLRLQKERGEQENDPAAKKSFKTRVYDLDDVRNVAPKVDFQPVSDVNNLTTEERVRIGRWGEKFVYAYLQRKIEEEGDQSKGKRIVWVNEVEESGAQYDLRIEDNFTGDVEAYVEVKTSSSREKQLFEMSYKEWNFAQREGSKYVIFRIMNAGKSDVELVSITNPFRQWKEMNLALSLSF